MIRTTGIIQHGLSRIWWPTLSQKGHPVAVLPNSPRVGKLRCWTSNNEQLGSTSHRTTIRTMKMKNSCRFAFAALIGIAVTSAPTVALAFDLGFSPLNRLGRVLGCGWGDGYHACSGSGCRPLANLPPKSYYDMYKGCARCAAGNCTDPSHLSNWMSRGKGCDSGSCDSHGRDLVSRDLLADAGGCDGGACDSANPSNAWNGLGLFRGKDGACDDGNCDSVSMPTWNMRKSFPAVSAPVYAHVSPGCDSPWGTPGCDAPGGNASCDGPGCASPGLAMPKAMMMPNSPAHSHGHTAPSVNVPPSMPADMPNAAPAEPEFVPEAPGKTDASDEIGPYDVRSNPLPFVQPRQADVSKANVPGLKKRGPLTMPSSMAPKMPKFSLPTLVGQKSEMMKFDPNAPAINPASTRNPSRSLFIGQP